MVRYDLDGKVAMVTGGARGIGYATCRALASRGARVVVVDLRAEDAERAAAAFGEDRALGLGVDVTDRGAMQRAVATAVERFGALDVVVANAGIAARGATVRATPPETFERVLEVNLLGVARTVTAALPEIVRTGGHVVVVSSIYAFTNGLGNAHYAMAKAGVEQLGRALRAELVPHGASASVAYFGFIDTEMVHRSIDADPMVDAMMAALPAPFRKRLPPQAAGEAIVAGIEARAARIIRPRRWTILSVLRGITGPLSDRLIERDAATQQIVADLDARGDQEQFTTA